MYMEAVPLSNRAAEEGRYSYTVRRYSLRSRSEVAVAAADWAQFAGNQLVVLSSRATLAVPDHPQSQAGEVPAVRHERRPDLCGFRGGGQAGGETLESECQLFRCGSARTDLSSQRPRRGYP